MAQIVAGLACSHAPSIAHAYDHNLTEQAAWKPLFDGFQRAHEWLMAQNPDVLVVIYNDHVDHYFYDAWPTFSIGIANKFPISDEGMGARAFPPVPGHEPLCRHIATKLVDSGVDVAASLRMMLDHGFLSPMPLLDKQWRVPVVPLTINVVLKPLPSPTRCRQFGAAIGEAIRSFPEDLRVAVMGTGGLSHQLTGENCGQVFPEWDREFMKLLEETPEKLNQYSMDDFARLGGEHSVEIVQWIAMRAALPREAAAQFRFYYPYGMMGYAILAFAVPNNGSDHKMPSQGAR